ncbi:snf1-related protein kinase catalytic subunit alpha kin10 [Phtheirospermum japonicum]|uniref:Snf1-related protein kinase catalytic subunit alpha kin10 n=1 Tax=Phtheirospermum japonicum TaxID=374723 RepID=A0A830C6H3_9LAMI|nr:snf1-related protein kinase catalytic subunit alpha kin10 [Phtheirospermum japonicum]
MLSLLSVRRPPPPPPLSTAVRRRSPQPPSSSATEEAPSQPAFASHLCSPPSSPACTRPPPPAVVKEAESSNEAERFEEVLRQCLRIFAIFLFVECGGWKLDHTGVCHCHIRNHVHLELWQQAKIDEEIIQEVIRIGLDRNALIDSLKNRVQNETIVAMFLAATLDPNFKKPWSSKQRWPMSLLLVEQ